MWLDPNVSGAICIRDVAYPTVVTFGEEIRAAESKDELAWQ
jgi:hypothetical protein